MTLSWQFFQPQVTLVEGQSLQQKEKKWRKWKGEKNLKIEKPKGVVTFLSKNSQNFDFCARPSQNVEKRDSSGKKGKLSCCQCIFHQIKANLAEIQPENDQDVQKRHFWQKATGAARLNFPFKHLSQKNH